MLYIKKRKEPDFLIRFKKKYPHKKYDSEEFREYRAPLNDILREEQKGLCAYCCCRIGKENSHNEHIQPQHQAMNANEASLDYSNLAASCNNKRTCGIKKKITMMKKSLYLLLMKTVKTFLRTFQMEEWKGISIRLIC